MLCALVVLHSFENLRGEVSTSGYKDAEEEGTKYHGKQGHKSLEGTWNDEISPPETVFHNGCGMITPATRQAVASMRRRNGMINLLCP